MLECDLRAPMVGGLNGCRDEHVKA